MAVLLIFGCTKTEWKVFSDDKFSLTYPDGQQAQPAGNEIFKVGSSGCMISVSKFEQQPSFSGFTTYIKGLWNTVDGITVENEYITNDTADFVVRATNESNAYRGSIRLKGCEANTVYVTLVGCERNTYTNNKATVDKIIDSVECN